MNYDMHKICNPEKRSFEYLSDRTKQTIINPVYVRRKPNKGLKIGGKVVGRVSVNRRIW
jgi:hypothetical protein